MDTYEKSMSSGEATVEEDGDEEGEKKKKGKIRSEGLGSRHFR